MSEPQVHDPFTAALRPIHDASHRHVADRLVYSQKITAEAEDSMSATARALASAVYELVDSSLLGDRSLFIDLPLEWLERPELLPTPAPRLALGIAETGAIDAELPALLDDIRERGYRILLPARLVQQDIEAMLKRCDILALTASQEVDDSMLEGLHDRNIKLLVENIESHDMLERFQALGCDYYNGDYLAKPSFIATSPRGRHGNRAAQLRLIRALYEDSSDINQLHELVIQLPHLHVAILRRANSSYFHRGGKSVDLLRAVQLLGLIELRRLILTLTLASLQPTSRIVLRMALIRAFMCRNLAAPFSTLDGEDAFTTGLFSMMDALLEEDRTTLLDQLPLGQPILAALKHRQGALGAVLNLCESHERQVGEDIDAVPADQLHRCYIEALGSADALMNNL